jgi:hypothetical protein
LIRPKNGARCGGRRELQGRLGGGAGGRFRPQLERRVLDRLRRRIDGEALDRLGLWLGLGLGLRLAGGGARDRHQGDGLLLRQGQRTA